MKSLKFLLVLGLPLLASAAQALTVDEVIRLKRAGVSDSTIELMLKGDGDSRSAGVWKTKDGWIVHTTETGERSTYSDERYYDNRYPIAVYPNVFLRRR
jgi:hypothetical protein